MKNNNIDHTKRIELLDGLRGIAIIAMVIYHGEYNLIYFYGIDIPLFFSPWMTYFLHPLFAGLFLFLSGICSHLSKNNLRRGVRLLILAILLSTVTAIFIPSDFILFGILHLLAVCILLYCLVEIPLNKLPPVLTGSVFIVLFIAAYIWLNYIPITDIGGVIMFVLGFPVRGFSSADYFPIFPWSFAFFSGACFGRLINRIPIAWKEQKWGIFALVGQHTLVIYLFHQPVLMLLMWLWFGR